MTILNIDKIILNSRFTPQLNGNKSIMNDYNIRCTGANKWVFCILIGLLFFLLSNSLVFYFFMKGIDTFTRKKTVSIIHYPVLIYNLLMTCVFIIILRLILW